MNVKSSFLKVGNTIINPTQIVPINLELCDRTACGVSISLSNGEFHVFEQEQARALKQYFLLGSNAIDLTNLFGQTNNGGQQQW